MCSEVVVLVGRRTAVTARVVVSDAPDDQITASKQRVLLIPTKEGRVKLFVFSCLFYQLITYIKNLAFILKE